MAEVRLSEVEAPMSVEEVDTVHKKFLEKFSFKGKHKFGKGKEPVT